MKFVVTKNPGFIPENVKDEGLKEAYIQADKQNWTKLELEDYLRVILKERDDEGRIEFAEKKAAMKIGKAMKEKGYTIAAIIDLTELSKEEVENL